MPNKMSIRKKHLRQCRKCRRVYFTKSPKSMKCDKCKKPVFGGFKVKNEVRK